MSNKRSDHLLVFACSALAMVVGAQPSGQQDVDGGANAYANEKSVALVPEVRVEDGKEYLYWPGWDQSKNRKLQVRRERTTHPDAQWWPHAGLGLFMRAVVLATNLRYRSHVRRRITPGIV